MYIIISTKTPKEMEDLLNSKYIIKELGNTWVTNGTIYQSFLGEKIEPSAFTKQFMDEPKLTTKDISAIKVEVPKLTPKKKPVKRKSRAKEKKDVPTISKKTN